MRDKTRPAGGLKAEWWPVGIDVVQERLAASGTGVVRAERRLVMVAANERWERQRFTVAHEVAHFLLAARPKGEISRAQEERLCDEFASEYLIGRAPLASVLHRRGLPQTPGDVLRLCGHFAVNVKPMLMALRSPLAHAPLVFVASRWRGHPKRDWETDMRVDAAAGHRQLFLPTDQRLSSLGLDQLSDWATRAPLHAVRDGYDLAHMPARRAAEPVWPGNVTWQARMQGLQPRFVVAAIEVVELVSAPRVPLALAA